MRGAVGGDTVGIGGAGAGVGVGVGAGAGFPAAANRASNDS